MTAEYDITEGNFVEGDDISFTVELTDKEGNPFDLTDVTKVWFTAKPEFDVSDADASIKINSVDEPTQVTYGGVDPGAGKIWIWLKAAQTTGLARYDRVKYDIQVLKAGLIKTLVRGEIPFEHEVTEATS